MVDPDDPARLLGLLGRRELVAVYTREIESLRAPESSGVGGAGAGSDRPR